MDKNRIEILHLIEGAKAAKGLTVIIDVFRAFSMECFLYDLGAEAIRPVGTIEEAFEWRERDQSCILCGERWGKMCEGFDLGNSPSAAKAMAEKIAGKAVIHTTSAGTQGIVNASGVGMRCPQNISGVDEIITGSLVNAAAIARYIKARNPQHVSLVAMGNGGVKPAPEDELCAEYIRSLLVDDPGDASGRFVGLDPVVDVNDDAGLAENAAVEMAVDCGMRAGDIQIPGFPGDAMPDIDDRIAALRYHGGEHFFNPDTQDVFPEPDFHLCAQRDIFDFVIRVERDEQGFYTRKIEC